MELEDYLGKVRACLGEDSEEGLEALGIHDNLSVIVNAPYESVLEWFNASGKFRDPRMVKANTRREVLYERRGGAIDVKVGEGITTSHLTDYGVVAKDQEAREQGGHIQRQKKDYNVALMICIRDEELVKGNHYLGRIARELLEIADGLIVEEQIPACLPDAKPEAVYFQPTPRVPEQAYQKT